MSRHAPDESAAPAAPLDAHQAAALAGRLRAQVERALRGKPEVVRQSVEAWVAGGHLLVEDVPGVGKTTLAHALARSVDATFRRIQFTSDLLPADLVGASVPEVRDGRPSGSFVFQPGPLFAQVVLADEINRASPKTQSALLEAMAEGSVSIDGVMHRLPQPFLVVATQNPVEHHGTHPLPESQLDRFLLRLRIGYPDPADEAAVLRDDPAATELPALQPVLHGGDLIAMRAAADRVKFDDQLVAYLLEIVHATREHPALRLGASPRGAVALRRAAQARALVDGRDYCIPEDVRDLCVPVLAHRVWLDPREIGGAASEEAEWILREILDGVAVPL
ncbi:MAG: ATPase [Proteobacteria bacterium]|nr:MAG: ATPase [Pseudomonadota bacterium]